MIKDTINRLKVARLVSNEELEVGQLFQAIKEGITQNAKLLEKTLAFGMGADFDLSQVLNVFKEDTLNPYGNLKMPFQNEFGRVSINMVPFGIVGLVTTYKITPINYLEIIKVCLETRNSLVIHLNTKNIVLELIVNIINDCIEQTTGYTKIVLTEEEIIPEQLDLLLYIGSKEDFNNLSTPYEKLFLGVGQYELYVDEELDPKLINIAILNDIKIFYPERDVYQKINREGANYCTAIMSGNKGNIREFIKNVKSSHLLVNMTPLLVSTVNLYPEQLLTRRTTVIYE